MPEELFAIGKVVGCFGVAGLCKLELLTDFPQRMKQITSAYLGKASESAVTVSLESVRVSGSSARVKFKGISDRNSAQKLIGQFVFIERASLTKLKKGRYYVHDLIGSAVMTPEHVRIGELVDVLRNTAQDVWVVRAGETEYLIPAVREFIESVDIDKKIVVIRPVEGLLDGKP